MNWEEVKEIIVPELVCTRRAGENLEDLIYRNVEGTDLAIIYRVKQQVANIVGSIKVSKQMMETWGVDENRIHEFAFHNMNQLSTLQIVELNSDFAMPEETFSELPEKMNKYSSYVFTNKEAFYGAATIMEEGMLHSIAERLQEGFYLLPMDVDNIVVYPEGMMKNLESIHSMVLIHNIQCLEPENYLSDQVYYYSKEKGNFPCQQIRKIHRMSLSKFFSRQWNVHRERRKIMEKSANGEKMLPADYDKLDYEEIKDRLCITLHSKEQRIEQLKGNLSMDIEGTDLTAAIRIFTGKKIMRMGILELNHVTWKHGERHLRKYTNRHFKICPGFFHPGSWKWMR